MTATVPTATQNAATRRIEAAASEMSRTLELIRQRRALEAEPEIERRVANLSNLLSVSTSAARELLGTGERLNEYALPPEKIAMAEAIQGEVDWQPIAWLDWGRAAGRSVARILRNGRGYGTGFLISERLLLTNNHVIPSPGAAMAMAAEFSYELDADEVPRPACRFSFDPSALFLTDDRDDLDYTIIALGAAIDHQVPVREFGSLFLSDSSSKHAVSNHVTLIQHPNGDYKLIVFRENRILHRGKTVLHYTADTEGGASGSPVFNDRFQVVALHHWGGPHREILDADGKPLRTDVNEGIRISAVLAEVAEKKAALPRASVRLLEAALTPRADLTAPVIVSSAAGSSIDVEKSYNNYTGVTRQMNQEAVQIDPDWDTRRGYNPRFLGREFEVPLPKLTSDQRRVAARIAGIGESSDSFVIPYHHFSVCLNSSRRLAFYTAVNIRGDKWINVDRDTGRVKEEAAEAREAWFVDRRVPASAQCDDDMYLTQNTRRRYFQRGHLVRRLDPTWGSPQMAEFANGDTFHFPNCAPQSQGFNDAKTKWAGIEDYVLYTASHRDDAVSVFSGPIFSDDDLPWAGILVPLQFFKIVARVEDGELVATALIADQTELAKDVIAKQRAREEAYEDWNDMSKSVREFHRSVAEVEKLTGLDFGPLRDADRPGTGGESLEDVDPRDHAAMDRLLHGAKPKRPSKKKASKKRSSKTSSAKKGGGPKRKRPSRPKRKKR